MTEGVMSGGGGVAGGYKCLYRGIHSWERIAFTPKVLLWKHFFYCYFVGYAKPPAR